MWQKLASIILKWRIPLLIILFAITGVMGYFASKVQMSYEFTSAIPSDNPKLQEYQQFRKTFGEDGNTLVIGIESPKFFNKDFFNGYAAMGAEIAKLPGVENVLSTPMAIDLVKKVTDTSEEGGSGKLVVEPIFNYPVASQAEMDSMAARFHNLPFYQGLLYNSEKGAYLMAVRINREILASPKRTKVVNDILDKVHLFEKAQQTELKYSGLPLIRTVMATKVQEEIKFFLLLSIVLTGVILLVFFRSISAVVFSIVVVLIGVVWSTGTLQLMGYKITLLTGLIPPLVVVIGIPNCVYFLNKYHSEYLLHGNKTRALVRMVERMGIVTLFTNLTAAIGFGVFYFTKSSILKEFGLVAGVNLMAIFMISLIFIPAVFSFLPPPNSKHTSYLDSKNLNRILEMLSNMVVKHRGWVYGISIAAVVVSAIGMTRLNAEGYIVDDLPHSDKIYTDLKWFEHNFKGVMPLEIVVDTKKKNGVVSLSTLENIDLLTQELGTHPEFGRPLSVAEGIKFARQAYYDGDSTAYIVPNSFDIAFLAPYLRMKGDGNSQFAKLVTTFMDSTRQKARISINMADIGSRRLPMLLDSLRPKVDEIFDSTKYKVTFTGTSITFLEGSKFIINSLRDSLILAFIMIFGCMIYLFRSWRIVFMSIVTNLIPLVITAGVMGWMGIRMKPSTVLVFSIALGITIDVTIRFLVNFKQELPRQNDDISATVHKTIHETGLSIIYTSLILTAGFLVFALSNFDGTKSLGYLTSLTLILAMFTNLTILPAMLLWMEKALLKKAMKDQDPVLDAFSQNDEEEKPEDHR
jgi:predicted RND superfamily exporter protein